MEQSNQVHDLGGRRPYIFELDEAEVAEVGDGEMRRLCGDDDLHQLHRLRAHQIHGRAAPASAAARHGVRACPQPVTDRRAAPPSDQGRSKEGFGIGFARAERSGSPAG
jgi:hypothetical protein